MTKRKQLVVILILGVLLLGISFLFIDDGFDWMGWLNSLVTNISLIFITIAVINFAWNLLGGDPQELMINSINLLAHTNDSGLVDFYRISAEFAKHPEWMEMLKSAKHEIDLMGYTLYSWTYGEKFADEIIKLSKRGIKIRVMIMDESNPELNTFINPQIPINSIDGVKKDIAAMQQVFCQIEKSLQNNKPKLVKVKKGVITSQINRFDETIYVTPYLYSVNTSESPLYKIKGSHTDLYMKYCREFNELWQLNADN